MGDAPAVRGNALEEQDEIARDEHILLRRARSLDLAAIVKAAHAIAESSELERVFERLLQIAIEYAGARRGLLIEEGDGMLWVVAEGNSDGRPMALLQGTSLLEEPARCCRAVVDTAWRTRAGLLIDDASADRRFAGDAYVVAKRLRSVLCLPIVHQGEISAILYLENDLARDAFDPQRIELIEILMAQGSISLANARLAQRMRREISEREHAEGTLRAIEASTAAVIGADFFRALVRNLARALGVRHAFVAECCASVAGARQKARMRAFWKGDHFGTDLEYETCGTPCETVLEGRTHHCADNVQALFPNDSSLVWWHARSYLGMPLLGPAGEVIGHMAILDSRPLTDASVATSVMSLCAGRAGAELERLKAAEGQQRALAEVQVLKNRLQEENIYLRRELIANVSHDLRSPLASLRGYLETLLLKEQALTESERRSYLEIALRQSQHLQTLISELFELARLDFEGYRIDAESVQLGELARDVAQKLGLAAQTRQVALDLDIEPELGLARADIGLIERTLTNLIENALAHTQAGGRIVLSMRAQGERVALCVSDNGSGIAAHDLPRIFERFYRADKARTRDDKGSGLGLAIVKRIVELHGSEIRVDSVMGRGTRVGFDLPLARALGDAAPRVANMTPP